MEEVIGSLAVAAVVVSFLLELVEEDLEVLMLEEEMGAELHHHLQSQLVVMLWQIPVEVVADQDLHLVICLLYTSPSPRDLSTSRMPSSA